MRFVRQDQLMSHEGKARVGHELHKPDKSHVTQIPSTITFLSQCQKINLTNWEFFHYGPFLCCIAWSLTNTARLS